MTDRGYLDESGLVNLSINTADTSGNAQVIMPTTSMMNFAGIPAGYLDESELMNLSVNTADTSGNAQIIMPTTSTINFAGVPVGETDGVDISTIASFDNKILTMQNNFRLTTFRW